MKERAIGKMVWGKVFGLIGFFLLVLVFQWLSGKYDLLILKYIYSFLFVNIQLIVIITLLFLIGEIFMKLDFPYNIPGPLFNAPAAVLITKFIFQFIDILGHYTNAFSFIQGMQTGIYYLVYSLTLIIGYIIILSIRERLSRDKDENKDKTEKKDKKSKKEGKESADKKEPAEKKRNVEWNEVGREFRLLGYDIAHSLRKLFKRKK